MPRPLRPAARAVLIASLLAAGAIPARAQSEGRVSVGGSVTFDAPTDDDVSSVLVFGPLVRLNPRKGWGPAGALNWFRADLANPAGGDADFAKLRIRPLMAGIGYTIAAGSDRTLVNFSVVAGPSFNRVEFDDEFLETQSGTPAIDVKNSFVVRPGISMTQTVAPSRDHRLRGLHDQPSRHCVQGRGRTDLHRSLARRRPRPERGRRVFGLLSTGARFQKSDRGHESAIPSGAGALKRALRARDGCGARFETRSSTVIFFFEQAGRYVRCEVLPLPNGASELIVTQPEGPQTVEVLSSDDVTRRIAELRESMLQAGWWGPVGREF